MINLLLSLILAGWVGAIAILAVQNATPVSLRFLQFQSIQIPLGVILAFSLGAGLLCMAIVRLLWKLTAAPLPAQSSARYEDEPIYDEPIYTEPTRPHNIPQRPASTYRTARPTSRPASTDDWLEESSDEW